MRSELTALLTLADEKLRAARLLIAGGAWGDASSRAYYAAFHAVSAALLSRGETYSRHGQVLGAFNKSFVHTGLLYQRSSLHCSRGSSRTVRVGTMMSCRE